MSTLALVSNPHLDDTSTKIRSKPVPWEGYQRANLVTAEELALIKRVDRQPRPKTESILVTDGQVYATLYLRLLKKLVRVDTMQYILVMIGDALLDHDERIPLFTKSIQGEPELPYGPLLSALGTQDEFIQLKTIQILTTLLSSQPTPLDEKQMKPLLNIIGKLVKGTSLNGRDVAVQSLEALLPRQECREALWATPVLINGKFDIVPLLMSIAQSVVKEKVQRVIVATYRNLVLKAPSANLPAMLVAKLLPFIKNLSTRKWSDEEIVEDIDFLKDELTKNFESLTTYDEYTSELSSGHLSWTPVHDSETFWKENASKLNERDYEQLKTLVALLINSSDPTVLAVASHDVGQYIKYYDRGKKPLDDLGGKTRMMELMTHENSDVRYQALITVQRLVSQAWVQ
ncbi:H(+)-transporting V1 sector ATPase subunit H [Tulasnella sp. 330]|nr:H(+)-transporting V1 sector ATPase subunit H [Tulasnella sp. 330]KAG8884186.1 H(+)-transporting V1 sector ATPase subunit H [Tulasnella sp. 331]KAG8889145.1 H(+)-transporting V1 sector ATPase subunit H [Tulasnella sp. 332]